MTIWLKEIFASSQSALSGGDLETGERFAMKTPSSNFSMTFPTLIVLLQENGLESGFKTQMSVKIIRQSRKRNFLYYLMEYVRGQGLDRWIRQNRPQPQKAIGW